MNKIGLYFGSFNPIHNGHIHVARQAVLQFKLDQVWIIVSPQNPFKENNALAPEHHRLQMARLACQAYDFLRVSDIEFSLPRPSFSITTLMAIQEQFPQNNYFLIVGEDNLSMFHLWKDFEKLLETAPLIVYPRANELSSLPQPLNEYQNRIHVLKGDLVNVSATEIRNIIHEGKSAKDLTPDTVIRYISANHLYA